MTILQDLKQGLRRMLKNPGFTLTAVLSLALGTGANTAIFQVVNAVRLRSLPVLNPRELVEVKIAGGTRGFGIAADANADATAPLWDEISRQQHTLSGVFAWGANQVRFGEGTHARLVRGLWLSPQTFHVLGLAAARGKLFAGCEADSAVISYPFWQTYFGGQDSAIGARIVVDDRALSIAGVAPREFFGLEAGKGFDVALPVCQRQAADPRWKERDVWWLTVMGRLQAKVPLAVADAQMRALSRGVFEAVPPAGYDTRAMDTWKQFRLTVAPAAGGTSRLRDQYGYSLSLLLAIAGMVLVIACANLANLLLAQAKARETEIAVRLALGMSRGRLVAQLVTENFLLAAAGTAAGSLVGSALSSFLLTLVATSHEPLQLDLKGDWRVVLFTLALAGFSCAAMALAPVMRLLRTGVAAAMRAGSRGGASQSRRGVFQSVLIGSQFALAIFLLVTSLSFVRSFRTLATMDAGFRQDGLVFCFADFSQLHLAGRRMAEFPARLLETVRRAPGVELASTSTHIPLSGNSWTLGVKGAIEQEGSARFSWIGSGYFHTLGVPLIAGRDFSDRDSAAARKVLIVNQTFARRFCREGSVLGSRIATVAEPGYPAANYEIVGVVKDARYDSLRESVPPAAYAPDAQNPAAGPWTAIVFRASVPVSEATGAVRTALAESDPDVRLHFEALRTMAADSMARERLLAWLSGFFAVLAAALTCVGLYGVTTYVVSHRRSEIAVRMAVGATSLRIVGMIVSQTAQVAAIGTLAGVALSLAGGRWVRSLLFGLQPDDPATLALAIGALAAVSILASVRPALQASGVDPRTALQGD